MPLMRSPEGEEVDVPTTGVRSLSLLGWQHVDKPKPTKKAAPRKRAAKKSE